VLVGSVKCITSNPCRQQMLEMLEMACISYVRESALLYLRKQLDIALTVLTWALPGTPIN
jgi:hypothetical protein